MYVQVDAVRLLGVVRAPIGAVLHPDRLVAYIPNTNAFGVDSFSYIVSDCPFKDERSSEVTSITLSITGVSNAPYIDTTTLTAAGVFANSYHVALTTGICGSVAVLCGSVNVLIFCDALL